MHKSKDVDYNAVENEMINLWKKADRPKRLELLAFFNHRILFLQHERHLHLLVTLFFGGISLLSGYMAPLSGNWCLMAIFAIVLITTLFYVVHYYYLENTCQKWQKLSIGFEKELLKTRGK